MIVSQPLWRRFAVFLGPLILSNVLQALSGTINNIYLGQMIGVGAFAAVSAFFPLLFFFISFVIGLGAGASVLIGQAYGARQPDKVKAIAGTALTATVVTSIIVAILSNIWIEQLFGLVGTPADILEDAIAYAHVMLASMPLLFILILVTSMMRGVSDTVTPLYVFGLTTVIGLVLTPALIRGWGGLPQMGVTSGAWAGIVSLIIGLGWMAYSTRRRGHPLAPDATFIRSLRIDWKLLGSVLRIGVPTGIQVILVSLATLVVLGLVNSFGSQATAAYGTVNQIVSYVQFPAISIAIAASIFSAQAIGAGRLNDLSRITRTSLVMNVIITGGLILLAYIFSRTIIGFFITSAEVLELAQHLLHITLWSYLIFGAASILSGVMRGAGTVMVPTILSVASIVFVEVPAAYLLSRTSLGLDGIWYAYPLAFTAMLAMMTAYYMLVWRKSQIKRLV
jgi:putative MATE family efflux protein